MMILTIVISTLMLLMALLLLSGRGTFLISGYNMLSKEEKSNYNEKALCRAVGKLILIVTICMILMFIGIHLENDRLSIMGTIALLVVIFGGLIYFNTGNRYLKEGVDKSAVTLRRPARFTKTALVIALITLVGVSILMFLSFQEPTVHVTQSNVRITGLYGVTVDFSEIAGINLIGESMREIGSGFRTSGVSGLGDVQLGNFRSNALGDIRLFVRAASSPTIHIERDGARDIFISFRDGAETERVYNELRLAWQ